MAETKKTKRKTKRNSKRKAPKVEPKTGWHTKRVKIMRRPGPMKKPTGDAREVESTGLFKGEDPHPYAYLCDDGAIRSVRNVPQDGWDVLLGKK